MPIRNLLFLILLSVASAELNDGNYYENAHLMYEEAYSAHHANQFDGYGGM